MHPQKPFRLKRPRYPMPDYVREALLARGVMEAYDVRPPYQQLELHKR